MPLLNRKRFLVFTISSLSIACSPHVQDHPLLITGKAIATRPANAQDVGSLPMNLILSPNGQYALTSDMGYHQALWSIRVSDGRGASHVDFSNEESAAAAKPAVPGGEAPSAVVKTSSLKTNGLYYGLVFGPDGALYAAQGGHDAIAILHFGDNGHLQLTGSIPTQKHDFPAGLALDDRGLLYVSNNAAAEADPYSLTGSVAIYNPATHHELGRYKFSDSHGGTSNFPLGIAVLHTGSKTYVASERDDAVYALDTSSPAHPALLRKIDTGAHPVAVLLDHDQKHLFVANSLGDTISIIDTQSDLVTGTILLRPRVARDIPGVSPVALALSPDQKNLYAALGDMNAIAVIHLSDNSLAGYIPTGWYPSSLAVTPDGKRLLVTNAKGHDLRNPNNVQDRHNPKRHATSLTVLEGNVTAIDIPSDKKLADLTAQVLHDNRLDTLARAPSNPLKNLGLQSGNITHVIYIIKENRTYDQILGDMPQGNGDPSLTLFGQNITPNQHALADRFVLLDNLYACGEVSGDGWDWSTQGMADAYVIRNIPYNYSHRGRRFDEEGQNNGYPTGGAPARDATGKLLWSYPPFHQDAPPIPDVANTGRNIWDAAREAHVSLRNYGFFMDFGDRIAGFIGGPDNIPSNVGLEPGGHDLAGITDLDYRHFDLDFPDSDASEFYYHQTGDKTFLFPTRTYGDHHLPGRVAEWNHEFQMMLHKDPTGAAVPSLMLIRLPTDHTVGAKSGQHSPETYVADNDYGLAQIVESVSKSPIWKHTAIFVIEDDAQSGIDHVDAHRTTAFIISPWIKSHSVDHHFYNTDSLLKTMELLLGLKPLSQYDAVADPILDWDKSPSNAAPYFATMPSKEIMAKRNLPASAFAPSDPRRAMAEASDKMDFTHADAAPARELDEITWRLVRGPTAPLPKPHGWSANDKDDDD